MNAVSAGCSATITKGHSWGLIVARQRADVAGGTYFFTVNLAERKRTLLVDFIDDLRDVMKKVKKSHPFHIDAMVVLPDHLHAMWTLPVNDANYPMRWSLINLGTLGCRLVVRYEPQHKQPYTQTNTVKKICIHRQRIMAMTLV